MNRRRCLSLLGMATAGLAFDPERLLWVPGRKTFFLPKLTRPVELAFHKDAFSLVWPIDGNMLSAQRALNRLNSEYMETISMQLEPLSRPDLLPSTLPPLGCKVIG